MGLDGWPAKDNCLEPAPRYSTRLHPTFLTSVSKMDVSDYWRGAQEQWRALQYVLPA
jgi:hypothetical protein